MVEKLFVVLFVLISVFSIFKSVEIFVCQSRMVREIRQHNARIENKLSHNSDYKILV
jgi:hypothetical protein